MFDVDFNRFDLLSVDLMSSKLSSCEHGKEMFKYFIDTEIPRFITNVMKN